ncbi:unnamed protein product [Urochloa decumbens]|uniref:F-box domain-containing protein n=1 Tax=Urochloa decumbens TaxID=240449 RepID=A0ABC9GUZ1_9POAL
MRPWKSGKRAVPPVGGSGANIDVLPDTVLEHILGFLPSTEAVQTSVLARRWRHLWKSATGLHVGYYESEPMSVEELRSLMNHLLLLTAKARLLTRATSHLGTSQVRTTYLMSTSGFGRLSRAELECSGSVQLAIIQLELDGLRLHDNLLNFSSCPALEHLEIHCCDLSSVKKIVSESLKHLFIDDTVCCSDSRIRIYTPKLISLRLQYLRERTPMLERMPSLVEAFVRIDEECTDCCNGASYESCDCESCENSDNMADGRSNCVLLKGMSEAKNLTLISEPKMFIFKRDLRWCPTFRKLKTLLLNDYWCVPDDFRALACILEHSPALEKLTLQILPQGLNPKVEMKLRVSPTKRSAAISEHLKEVELKCEVVDGRVLKVLKFLSAFNIYFSFE